MAAPEGSPVPPDLVVMAQVKEPYGLKGWVKMYTYGESRDGLGDFSQWWCNRGTEVNPVWQLVIPEAVADHGGTLVAKWPGVEDRDAAFALKGLQVAVPRALFAQTAENEYYWSDLIGLEVRNRQDETLGQVAGLLDLGPHQVLRVRAQFAATMGSGAMRGADRSDGVSGAKGAKGAKGPADIAGTATAQGERLIPFVAQYVDTVDLAGRVIRVDWSVNY